MYLLSSLNNLVHCCNVSIADFGKVNAGWDKTKTQKRCMLGEI